MSQVFRQGQFECNISKKTKTFISFSSMTEVTDAVATNKVNSNTTLGKTSLFFFFFFSLFFFSFFFFFLFFLLVFLSFFLFYFIVFIF